MTIAWIKALALELAIIGVWGGWLFCLKQPIRTDGTMSHFVCLASGYLASAGLYVY